MPPSRRDTLFPRLGDVLYYVGLQSYHLYNVDCGEGF